MKSAVWWIRRDLRLRDNQALHQAMTHAEQVIPVFVLDSRLWDSPYTGEKRMAFLWEGLAVLKQDLQAAGSTLVVLSGRPEKVLAKLLAETGARAIFSEEDFTPFARQRDASVAAELPLNLVPGITAKHPEDILKDDGTPYTVFTPFSKKWKVLSPLHLRDILPPPEAIPTPVGIASRPLPSPEIQAGGPGFPAGEAEAQRRLSGFLNGETPPVYDYKALRDRPDLDGTSKLSPYFRFGMLSAREAAVRAQQAVLNAPGGEARKSAETFLNEIIWREFFQSILYHFPHVREGAFRPEYRNINWANDEQDFKAWEEGRTGYPVVDAAMRQLVKTGWMHNRARMITASFLTKDLLIDWQWGEEFFMQHLVDGDPASNNGGWQWAAGTGTDAAPYFRIFNPVLQSKKFDPEGTYIRRYVPELAGVPDKYIHTPWEMPLTVQRQAGCIIGRDYPEPIVEHSWARDRTLDAYRQAKEYIQDKQLEAERG